MNDTTENKTIGQMIGILTHSFKVSQYKGGPSTSLRVKVDFTTASDSDIKGWLTSNRIIACQRPLRGLSENELEALNDTTFIAQNIGQKVKSREDKVQELVNAGLPLKLAEFSVDNPTEFQNVVSNIDVTPKPKPDENIDEDDITIDEDY